MKLTLEQITQGMEEIIIRYREVTPEIARIISCIKQQEDALLGVKDGKQFMIYPREVVYLESVEGNTFLYTQEEVYRLAESLTVMETRYREEGFFRCSKSMVINMYRIKCLKSETGNRIDAQMDNGEHVIISRRYARELRAILKGGEV